MKGIFTVCVALIMSGLWPSFVLAQNASESIVISSENRPLPSLRKAAADSRAVRTQALGSIMVVPNHMPKEDTRSQPTIAGITDPIIQSSPGIQATSVLNVFNGADNDDNGAVIGGFVSPPDPDGDVGPNHYVQMINLVTTVFDKNGNVVPGGGPFPGNAFWNGQGGSCEAFNNGDPIVLYDETNDRWLFSQFAFDDNLTASTLAMCIAVSQTGDPLGAWNRYEYNFSSIGLPDYPKLGFATESVTFMANIFSPPFFSFGGTFLGAIDKAALYAGQTAQFVGFNLGTSEFGFVAGDLDDASGTAAFVPALFATAMSRNNLFDIWEIDPDFANGATSPTATRIAAIPISPFDSDFCFAAREACIPQPNTQVGLETLSGRLMQRLQIRDFGSYRTMLASHSVDVGGGRAGVRWYEMRESGGTWSLHQEGTYAPSDGENRWMSSIAMNAAGDIGVGYLLSSNSTFVSAAVAGQTAANSGTGILDSAELICAAGTGSQTGSERAGDYSATAVDPVTDTFWHTNEYMGPTGSVPWRTTICEFAVSGGPPPTNQPPVVAITSPQDGASFNEGIPISFSGTATDNEDGTISDAISWTSDLDGLLGTGQNIVINLSLGVHAITASVTDSEGSTDTEVISVTVNPVIPGGNGDLETVVVSNVSSTAWTTVPLSNTYSSMVVVCTPEYVNNTIPQVVRMRNASGSSFEISLQNPSDSPLAGEEVYCLIVEEGAWELPDGRLLEAQKYVSTVTDENNSWVGEPQTYLQSYVNPVVLGQVMTYNDTNWSVFWDKGTSLSTPPSSSTLFTGKTVAEDPNTTRADETIGFVVIEAGTGTVDGVLYEASLGSDIVAGVTNNPPYTYSFTQSFGTTPAFAVATMSAVDGANGAWAYLFGASPLSSASLNVAVDEDQVGDSERGHTTEQVAYLVFEESINITLDDDPPPVATNTLETVLVSGVSSAAWTTVTLDNSYTSMVAVCSVVYENNTVPMVIRLRNAAGNSFDVALQSPSGLPLEGETVYCIAIEEGTWQLPDGRLIEAVTYESTVTDQNNSWVGELQSYAQSYTNPVVLGQVMTFNDTAWSTFWNRGSFRSTPPSSTILYTGKHVAEDPVTTRAVETIGYIVVEAGSGTVNAVPYEATLGSDLVRGITNGGTYRYFFSQDFGSAPEIAVVTMAGMDGANGAWAYVDGANAITTSSIDVAVDEDILVDLERFHTTEQVAYMVFGSDVTIDLTPTNPLVALEETPLVKEDRMSLHQSVTPEEFALVDVYPNPFRERLTVRYGVPKAAHVKISMYNILGQLVDVMVDKSKAQGYHQFMWEGNGSDQALVSGMYIIRLEAEGAVHTHTVTYLK